MGRIQEGGVLTQKVSLAIGIVAILMMGAFLCCPFSSDAAEDENVYVINVTGDSDFCGKNTSLTSSDAHKVKYTLNGDNRYNYSAQLLSSDDVSSGKIDDATGQLYSGTPCYRTITVTAPLESGDYRLVVSFYASDDTKREKDVIAEKTVPLTVVDPVVLTFTLKNDGSNAVNFTAFFVIDGKKVDDSEQEISIPANGTKDVTYNYYVKDIEDTKYYLDTDSSNIKSIVGGMGEGNTKTFYAHDADYTVITTIVVVVLVIMAIILFFVMRKPVINKGKPKGRR